MWGEYNTGTDIANMNAKMGYLLFVRGNRSDINALGASVANSNTTLRATGTLAIGDQPFSGLATTDGNFSLITNPYASPINWATLHADGNTNNFESYYTYWDPNVNTRGGYVTVTSGGTTSIITAPGAGTVNANVHIQSGQAFFVKEKQELQAMLSR